MDDDSIATSTRFLHFAGLLVHYRQEVPRWTNGRIPTEMDIVRAGVTEPRGLKYIPDTRIPGYGSGTRVVEQSGVLLNTVFLQVCVAFESNGGTLSLTSLSCALCSDSHACVLPSQTHCHRIASHTGC